MIFLGVHRAMGCRQKSLIASVAVPPAPANGALPECHVCWLLANDKSDNDMIPGAVHSGI